MKKNNSNSQMKSLERAAELNGMSVPEYTKLLKEKTALNKGFPNRNMMVRYERHNKVNPISIKDFKVFESKKRKEREELEVLISEEGITQGIASLIRKFNRLTNYKYSVDVIYRNLEDFRYIINNDLIIDGEYIDLYEFKDLKSTYPESIRHTKLRITFMMLIIEHKRILDVANLFKCTKQNVSALWNSNHMIERFNSYVLECNSINIAKVVKELGLEC